jgi:hypothetical protein
VLSVYYYYYYYGNFCLNSFEKCFSFLKFSSSVIIYLDNEGAIFSALLFLRMLFLFILRNQFFWHRNEFNVPPWCTKHTHAIIIVIDMSNYYSVKLFCVDKKPEKQGCAAPYNGTTFYEWDKNVTFSMWLKFNKTEIHTTTNQMERQSLRKTKTCYHHIRKTTGCKSRPVASPDKKDQRYIITSLGLAHSSVFEATWQCYLWIRNSTRYFFFLFFFLSHFFFFDFYFTFF